MLKTLLKPRVLELIEERDWKALRDVVTAWPPAAVADLLMNLRKNDRVLLFRSLPSRFGSRVFATLQLEEANALLRDMTDEETRHLLADIAPDRRTELLSELPGQVTQRLINLLDPEDLEEAKQLLGYPENSVGRLMTPDYVAVRPDWTVQEAVNHIRSQGKRSETIYHVYVTDADWRLLDDIELRFLIMADPDTRIEELMDHSFISVSAGHDRKIAVQLIQRYDLLALPVVDSDGVLLGIVTVDDVLDVAEQEATEDFHKAGSVGPIKTSLREVGVGFLYKRRIGWLLILVFINIFAGAILEHYEDTITAVVALVFFLPLLIDSAGNAGSQAATLMVRALATGDVKIQDWMGLIGKELGVAAALGVTMALAVALLGIYRGGPEVAVVVSATMVLVILIGSVVGMSLPFLLSRFNVDPATASAPLITSIADIAGVLVYFSIASWYLSV